MNAYEQIRDALNKIKDNLYEIQGLSELDDIRLAGLRQIAINALAEPARNQEVLAAPTDLNDKFIHIGDCVHMLNTRHDGDHEWDDVVLSLEYVGKGEGDDWLVYGENGAAWACECEVLEGK